MSSENLLTDTARTFDLTKGAECIDCSLHCPTAALGERYPNFVYTEDDNSKKIGPFCGHKNAPFAYEAKPRSWFRRNFTTAPRRICLKWKGNG